MEDIILRAIEKQMAIVRFNLDGKVIDVNANFLKLMRYKKKDFMGKYHSALVDERQRESQQYKIFWKRLCAGQGLTSDFRRLRGDLTEVWIQAVYYPIKSEDGKVASIVKIAMEIDNAKLKYYDSYLLSKKIEAINTKIPIIEFSLDGTILDANESYLKLFEYELDEIVGKKHCIFVPEYESDPKSYYDFWEMLTSSQMSEGDFVRIGKCGKKVSISAVYYPLIDAYGKCNKIIKVAVAANNGEKLSADRLSDVRDCLKEVIDLSHRASSLLGQ